MPNRMLLIVPTALGEQMEMRGWCNERLAKDAECAPGTIDNLMNGRANGSATRTPSSSPARR